MDLRRRFHGHLLKVSKCGKYVIHYLISLFFHFFIFIFKFVVICTYLLLDSEEFTKKPCRWYKEWSYSDPGLSLIAKGEENHRKPSMQFQPLQLLLMVCHLHSPHTKISTDNCYKFEHQNLIKSTGPNYRKIFSLIIS